MSSPKIGSDSQKLVVARSTNFTDGEYANTASHFASSPSPRAAHLPRASSTPNFNLFPNSPTDTESPLGFSSSKAPLLEERNQNSMTTRSIKKGCVSPKMHSAAVSPPPAVDLSKSSSINPIIASKSLKKIASILMVGGGFFTIVGSLKLAGLFIGGLSIILPPAGIFLIALVSVCCTITLACLYTFNYAQRKANAAAKELYVSCLKKELTENCSVQNDLPKLYSLSHDEKSQQPDYDAEKIKFIKEHLALRKYPKNIIEKILTVENYQKIKFEAHVTILEASEEKDQKKPFFIPIVNFCKDIYLTIKWYYHIKKNYNNAEVNKLTDTTLLTFTLTNPLKTYGLQQVQKGKISFAETIRDNHSLFHKDWTLAREHTGLKQRLKENSAFTSLFKDKNPKIEIIFENVFALRKSTDNKLITIENIMDIVKKVGLEENDLREGVSDINAQIQTISEFIFEWHKQSLSYTYEELFRRTDIKPEIKTLVNKIFTFKESENNKVLSRENIGDIIKEIGFKENVSNAAEGDANEPLIDIILNWQRTMLYTRSGLFEYFDKKINIKNITHFVDHELKIPYLAHYKRQMTLFYKALNLPQNRLTYIMTSSGKLNPIVGAAIIKWKKENPDKIRTNNNISVFNSSEIVESKSS